MLADHVPREETESGCNQARMPLVSPSTGPSLESVRNLARVPASALRVARARSKKLIRETDNRIRKWRAMLGRKRSGATFIAVTGSSAKGTTAALISHILGEVAPVGAQIGNNSYRSHEASLQSVPHVRFFISETSSRGPGTLQPILDIVRPTVGVVTLVALEHKSAFRSIEAVAEEKQKLIEALPADGLAVLNHDDERVACMSSRTRARTVTFGKAGGDYVVSNVRCERPEALSLTITHGGEAFDLTTSLTGSHFSVPVAAAFACTHQLGIPAATIISRIASFTTTFARCSVHRVENGPVIINDASKAPYHSIQLALDMLAGFQAPRKRIVLGNISDSARSDRIYAKIYRAARAVADQVVFIGEHSHRARATAEEIADGRFVRFDTVKEAADFLQDSAIANEIILVKGAGRLHLERLVMMFFAPVRCWEDACGRRTHCIAISGRGCSLYKIPFEQHKAARQSLVYPLPPDRYFG